MKHLEALDGLRGFAALGVLAYHLGHWWHLDGLAANAYLAVDFFFCLSGYVLPLAYNGPKYRDLTFASFFLLRVVRLMPLILLAGLVSAAYLVLKLTATHAAAGALPALSKALLLGSLSLPDFGAPPAIGGPQIFPLNGPQYTLMLEFVVNLVWFAIRRRATLPVCLTISVVSFLVLARTGIGGDTPATILWGLPRVFASFFAGVALFQGTHGLARAGHGAAPFTLGGVLPCLSMAALFFWPHALALPAILAWSAIVVPVIVFAAARASLPAAIRKIAVALGALSYPLYALHYPIFCWVNGLMQVQSHHQIPALEAPVVVAAVVFGSALALRFYDEPVRRWLSSQLKARTAPRTTPSAPVPART